MWANGIEERIVDMDKRLALLRSGGKQSVMEGGQHRKMYIQLDEDTTKCLIQVDGHDVHNKDELRAKRKELVARLTAIAESTADLVN